uniref:Uncharacterized protein n=1 Tax=Romanomermis culicivorax TaxID=13658 RepID=A0A915J6P8_ROMCU
GKNVRTNQETDPTKRQIKENDSKILKGTIDSETTVVVVVGTVVDQVFAQEEAKREFFSDILPYCYYISGESKFYKMLVKLLTFVVIAVEVKCQSLDNQKPRAKGFENRTAVVYANNIKGQDAKNRDYNLERKKGEADLHLAGGSKNYLTNAANGRASAQGAGGKTAIATKIGSGGTYETPRNKGDYR